MPRLGEATGMRGGGVVNLMRAASCAAMFAVSGCALTQPKPIVQYKTVEVPTYIHTQIKPDLIKACEYAEPDPACWSGTHREFCNGQLADMLIGYRDALARCNADKTAIKAADK